MEILGCLKLHIDIRVDEACWEEVERVSFGF